MQGPYTQLLALIERAGQYRADGLALLFGGERQLADALTLGGEDLKALLPECLLLIQLRQGCGGIAATGFMLLTVANGFSCWLFEDCPCLSGCHFTLEFFRIGLFLGGFYRSALFQHYFFLLQHFVNG